jgi:hypothetical protein
MKKAFILYLDYWETIRHLNDEQLGALTRMLFEYQKEGILPETSHPVFLAFSFIKTTMDRDMEKWETKAEKSRENGQKGGRPSKNQEGYIETQKTQQVISEPKKPVKGKVSVSDKVSVTVNDTVNENEIGIYIPSASLQVAPKIKPKGKHLFKNSPYFDFATFSETFKSTTCFARHPNLDIELIHEMMVNSEAKGYMYLNWIQAAANWVSREPHKYTKSIKSAIQKDPAFALMTKGDIARAEHDAKMALQRKLINNGNDPYSY